MKTIYTIGHSTHPIEQFIEILRSFDIEILADIRSIPGSKWQLQFNRIALEMSLHEAGIKYIHMPDLGGKRISATPSDEPFGGYTAYMATEQFVNAICILEQTAVENTLVYMCAEALWTNCHRSMVSARMQEKGWEVIHILNVNKQWKPPPPRPRPAQGSLF